jgi:putative membrane protein
MKRMFTAIVVATALIVVQVHSAHAQSAPVPDRDFLIDAARGGIAEVELGRLAAQRASTEPVRQFAQKMVTEHGAANQDLMRLAQQKGVTLPQEMDAAHRATMDRLATLSGAAFDQAYMSEMVKDHHHAAALYTREAREGQDADVRALANKGLTRISEHQRLAFDIHSRMAQAPAPVVVAPAPPVAVSASPATVTTITTTVTPAPPYCGGAYLQGVGTNFGACTK